MTSLIRAGVVGAGVFGGYHAGKWAGFTGAALAAVHDPDADRAAALAGRHGAVACADAASFLERVDVVSIAAPAGAHAQWAMAALRAGKPVYVEKPLATDLAEADAIVAEAARRGLIVACGFLERAAFQAIGLYGLAERPLRIEAVRRGTPSPRNRDVSVVLDLMIHDLDLVLSVAGGAPFAVEAEGERGAGGDLDVAEAEICFDDGLVARVSASRVAAAPERSMTLVYPSGRVFIDFVKGTLDGDAPFALDAGFAATPAGSDRLGASLGAFLAAVKGEIARPLADGRDGARSLDLALAVQQAAGE